jgi:hypothetical protein
MAPPLPKQGTVCSSRGVNAGVSQTGGSDEQIFAGICFSVRVGDLPTQYSSCPKCKTKQGELI